MEKIENFFSATGLVWCGIFSLMTIGIIYIIKRDEKIQKEEYTKKIFWILYLLTIMQLILELFIQHSYPLNKEYPMYANIVSKIYIFSGMLWNLFVILYYMFYKRKKKEKKITFKFLKNANTIIICTAMLALTAVLTLPVQYIYVPEENFYILGGLLNTIYNRVAIIADSILLIYILINSKIISKQLVYYSLAIFILYIVNLTLEGVLDYSIKDAVFTYSLFVAALYYTTESQDKKIMEEYDKSKALAEEMDIQKTKFLLNMSHEIRTPLNTIMGYSDYLLMKENLSKDKIEMEGENVYQASETLLSLINNILDVSRIESGKETLIENDYKLEDLIQVIYDKTLPKTALRNNVKFNLEVSEDLPANYNGDLAKLERILLAILQNAVEHTTMGEVKLKIEGKRNNDEIEMTYAIRNAGHEMREDRFNMDFNSITSLETTENIDNNILGIIIAKQLLTLMNGTIEFINKPSQGTQYIIRLKQKCYGQDTIGNIIEKIKKSTEEEIVNCEGKIAIVADDNAINLNIAKRLLVKFGFTVETCLNGQECLEMVRNKKYDMIFLDHMMPGMDGVETLNHLKEEHGMIPPTIALTANASDDSRSEYMALGFTDYLTKPIDMKELNRILKREFKN